MSGRLIGRLTPWLPWLLALVGFLVFIAANTHLIYVAIHSQPDCVAYVVRDAGGIYRAAKPSC